MVERSHRLTAMLTFSREELRLLIDGLDHARAYTGSSVEGDANDALRKRLVFAADSLPPKEKP